MVYISAGLAAGFIHAISGPDHLAAMAPLAMTKKNKAWVTGLVWGLGHTGGVLILTAIAIAFRESFSYDAVSSISEYMVGVALIIVGLWGIHHAFLSVSHAHEHEHDDTTHEHIHLHAHDGLHEHERPHTHNHAALTVGALHGLAGGSHFIGALPALAMPLNGAIAYLIAFGIGSIAAMAGFSALIGRIGLKQNTYRWSLGGFSAIAIVVGCFWLMG